MRSASPQHSIPAHPHVILRCMLHRRLALLLLPLTACPTAADDTSTGASTSASASTTSPDSSSTTEPAPTTSTSGSTTTSNTTTATTTDPQTTGSTTDPGTTTGGDPVMPTVLLPRASIVADELALLVNDQDPQSMAVAAYYQEKRQIPADNIVTLSFPPADSLSAADFTTLKTQIDAAVGPQIQAFAVAWTNPHRVDCQSLVSALALGVDNKYCSTQGNPCSMSAASGYYDSPSLAPFTDLGIRPAMHLAGVSADEVYKVIDRGVAADGTFPTATGYFLRTTDPDRSVRWPQLSQSKTAWAHEGGLTIEYIDNSAKQAVDFITNKTDVLFYLTGLASVPEIASNTYLPGAIADHLTSYGGQIPQSGQMSIVRWLEAGATASYGTAFEPCNYPWKFPNSLALLPHYFRGETLIEAYWKSVDWPGEGVFVGEPLARPWGGAVITWQDLTLTIETTQLIPKQLYALESGPSEEGPWTIALADISIAEHQRAKISLPGATEPFYRLVPTP